MEFELGCDNLHNIKAITKELFNQLLEYKEFPKGIFKQQLTKLFSIGHNDLNDLNGQYLRILVVNWQTVLTPCFIQFNNEEKNKWKKIFKI